MKNFLIKKYWQARYKLAGFYYKPVAGGGLIAHTDYVAGNPVAAAGQNSNENAIFNEFNGNIENVNIKANAGIVDTKLAQITTAGKVSGAALTLLTSVPSGAGILPSANTFWGPDFSVNKGGSAQTGIATATFTKLTWSTELYDSNSNFATSTFTCTIPGVYHFIGAAGITSLADTKSACVALYKNGSRAFFGNFFPIGATFSSVFTGAWDIALVATDTVDLYVYHENGSNRDVDGGVDTTYFMGHYVRP